MTTTLALAALAWIGCGALAYGLTFAFFQRERPELADKFRAGDRVFALTMAALAPAGLMVALGCSGFAKHGLMFRAPRGDAP